MQNKRFMDAHDRSRIINRVSLVDTLLNLLIGVVKLLIAYISGSVAIASDSVLNIGDTISGIISIIGNKISERRPTKKHPFGFGRLEYITTIVVSSVMITVGFEFARIAVNHIIKPVPTHLTPFDLLILIILVIIKCSMYFYNRKAAKMTENGSLESFSRDSLIDTVGSSLTITLVIIDYFVPLELDGWISLGVSVLIIFSCLYDIYQSIDKMVGENLNPQLIEQIKESALELKPIEGVRNILIHSYGYNIRYGQMDVQLPDNMDIRQASIVLKKLEEKLEDEFDITFTFGIWPENLTYKNTIHRFHLADKGVSILKKPVKT